MWLFRYFNSLNVLSILPLRAHPRGEIVTNIRVRVLYFIIPLGWCPWGFVSVDFPRRTRSRALPGRVRYRFGDVALIASEAICHLIASVVL